MPLTGKQRKNKGKCSVEGCNKPAKVKGLCQMHYARKQRHGDPLIKLVAEYESDICRIEGCSKKRHACGYCSGHYAQLKRQGKIKNSKKCKVPECTAIAMAKGYCEKHYARVRKFGDPFGFVPREETRGKQRLAKLRNPMRYWLGKKRPDMTEKISGEKAPNWRGGISFELYGRKFNKMLKKQIRCRDNFTCQECYQTEKEIGYKLVIHHIDYNKKNNSPRNLIALCKSCHAKTGFSRTDWTNYFLAKKQQKIITFKDTGS